MAKTRTNKNRRSKNTNKTRSPKPKQDKKLLLIFASLFVILMIVGYFILGLLFTAFMGVGILIIVGLAKLVDSVKNKPKKKKNSMVLDDSSGKTGSNIGRLKLTTILANKRLKMIIKTNLPKAFKMVPAELSVLSTAV